jgi:Zn-dependent M28 family amino/carboxypeptidase
MPEPTPENGYYYRSDHFNFAKAGVPAIYFKLGVDDREHGMEWGMARRREHDLTVYHTVADEYGPDRDLRGGLEDLQLMYAVGAELAYGRHVPSWSADSEFRAVRERSLEASRGAER